MPNLSQYQITPPPTKSEFDALSTKIGNTAMGTTATTVTGAIKEVNKDKLRKPIQLGTYSTNSTYTMTLPDNFDTWLLFATNAYGQTFLYYVHYSPAYGKLDLYPLITPGSYYSNIHATSGYSFSFTTSEISGAVYAFGLI